MRDERVLARLLYNVDLSTIVPPDIIVGSGSHSMGAGVLLSRFFDAKFIYSGWPGSYNLRPINLLLVNTPRFDDGERCAYVPVPSVIAPEDYSSPRVLHSIDAVRGACLALLVGGRSHSHRYSDHEWAALASFVEQSADRLGIRWSVSTSRRSPAALRPKFETMAAEGRIVQFVDYETAGAGSADLFFGMDAVVVTEDSLSMMAEAQAARRPVVALRPELVEDSWANEVVAAMAARGGLAVLPLVGLNLGMFVSALTRLRVQEDDPRDILAKALTPILEAVRDDRKESRT